MSEAGLVARVLNKSNKLVARAANVEDALQAVCDVLVEDGGFAGASVGFNQAGNHRGTFSNQCFLLKVDGELLGALTVSSVDPAAFTPELVDLFQDWSEGFAQLLAVARRRALHGSANACGVNESDLEERRRTEAALRRSEAFLTKAQRLSATGSFSWTTSTGLLVWSEETYRIFGYEHGPASPTIRDLLARVDSSDRERAREILGRAASHGQDIDAELRLGMPDGSRKYIRIVAQAVGCPVTGEFVGAVMDITATKEMTEALAFRDQVMGILGHDLRNPIAGILGVVGLTRLVDAVPPTIREQLDHIETSARRMSEMIETILDFTQTRFAGRLPLSPAPTDLCELCSQVVEEIRAGHSQRRIDVAVRGDTTGRWDAGRVAQVVSNLLGNALTHGDADAPVRLVIDGATDVVAISVHNSGRAIDRALMPVLFEPFRRGNGARTGRSRGLGLGLHIVKQIVVAHGGSISVESSEDDGTTFCVSLPRHQERSGLSNRERFTLAEAAL